MRITPATNSINSANTTKERNADYSINNTESETYEQFTATD